MAYARGIRERAKTLFLVGYNAEDIANLLRADFPTLSANTILAWAREPDDRGLTWEDYRNSVELEVQKNTMNNVVGHQTQTAAQLAELTNKFYKRLTNSIGDGSKAATNPEQVAYAFIAMAKFGLSLSNDSSVKWEPRLSVRVWFEAMEKTDGMKEAMEP